jgi:nuclear protein localization family protein 4
LPARDYPGSNGQAGQMLDDGFEIPPDVDQPPAPINNNDDFDMAGAEDNAGGGGGGMLVCPHCTYENEPGAMDCDVCGLPCA